MKDFREKYGRNDFDYDKFGIAKVLKLNKIRDFTGFYVYCLDNQAFGRVNSSFNLVILAFVGIIYNKCLFSIFLEIFIIKIKNR